MDIHEVDTCASDLDQHLAVSRLRNFDILTNQDFGSAILFYAYRFHGIASNRGK
jgi:hypothetical protein